MIDSVPFYFIIFHSFLLRMRKGMEPVPHQTLNSTHVLVRARRERNPATRSRDLDLGLESTIVDVSSHTRFLLAVRCISGPLRSTR